MTPDEIVKKLNEMADQILTPSSKGKHFFREAAALIESQAESLRTWDIRIRNDAVIISQLRNHIKQSKQSPPVLPARQS